MLSTCLRSLDARVVLGIKLGRQLSLVELQVLKRLLVFFRELRNLPCHQPPLYGDRQRLKRDLRREHALIVEGNRLLNQFSVGEVSERQRSVRRNLDVRELDLGRYLYLRLYQELPGCRVCECDLRDRLLIEIRVVNAVIIQHDDMLMRAQFWFLLHWNFLHLALPRIRSGFRLLGLRGHFRRTRLDSLWFIRHRLQNRRVLRYQLVSRPCLGLLLLLRWLLLRRRARSSGRVPLLGRNQ